MEREIMDLRRKATTHKLIKRSVMLDEILDCQKSSDDRIGLGYNKMKENSRSGKGVLEYKTPLFVKEKEKEFLLNIDESQKKSPSCQNSTEKSMGSKEKLCTCTPFIESKGVDQKHKKKTPPDSTSATKSQDYRYEYFFNGYYFTCYEFGHRAIQCKNYYQRGSRRLSHSVRCWK